MSDYNEQNRNTSADTESKTTGYQPPQYTQQYTAQNNGYQPPNYSQQYNPSHEQPTYSTKYIVPLGYPQKSRIAAALLAFLFGTFGVHNFYLGYTGKGIAQLLLSTIGIILCGLGPIITFIWCIYEGIQLLKDTVPTDGHGIPFID